MNLRSDDVKNVASVAGSNLCRIAPVDWFAGAHQGFHPTDIFPRACSLVVVAIRFPEGPFHAHTMVPYAAANDALMVELFRMLCKIALALEKKSPLEAVPVPGEPYEYWDEKKLEGRGILSLKHDGHRPALAHWAETPCWSPRSSAIESLWGHFGLTLPLKATAS